MEAARRHKGLLMLALLAGTAAAALLVGLLAKRFQPPLQRGFRRAGG